MTKVEIIFSDEENDNSGLHKIDSDSKNKISVQENEIVCRNCSISNLAPDSNFEEPSTSALQCRPNITNNMENKKRRKISHPNPIANKKSKPYNDLYYIVDLSGRCHYY